MGPGLSRRSGEPMANPLRILFVEDVDDDAELVGAHLRRAGFAPIIKRVETAEAMAAALAASRWDLVLSDFALPRFSAPDALNLLHDSGQDLPFIIVSGTIQEEEAVAALRAGAHDFIVKNRLTRLVPSITRELRDAEDRAARRREQALRQELEAGFQLLFANSPLPMWMFDPQTLQFVEVNEAAIATYGYSRDEFLQMRISDIRPGEDVPALVQSLEVQRGAFRPNELWRHRWKDGTLRDVEVAAHSLEIGGRALTLVVVQDVTERKRAEDALRASEARYRHIFESAGVSIWEEDFSKVKAALDELLAKGVTDVHAYLQAHPEFVQQTAQRVRLLDVNAATLRLLQASSKAELLISLGRVLSAENLRILQAEMEAIARGQTYFEAESVSHTLKNENRDVLLTMTIPSEVEQFSSVLVSLTDITERKRRDRELEAVAAVSAALRTTQTLDGLLTRWLDMTLAAMNATGGSIWLYDPRKDELQPAVLRGWNQPAGAGPLRTLRPGEGVNGHVFVTRQPYISSNFALDPRLAEGTRERIPPGGGAGIPIPVGDAVIGTFLVNTPLGHEVTRDEVHLLSTLAEIAGSAIQRTRFLEQIEQRLAQLSALREIDRAITGSLDIRVSLDILLQQVTDKLKVDAAGILLFNDATAMLTFTAGRGFRTRSIQQTSLRLGESYAGRAALERRIVQASDLRQKGTEFQNSSQLAAEDFASYVGAPLIGKGRLLGVLEVFHRAPLAADTNWLDFLEALAGQAAIAIDNAVLFDHLQRSNTDLAVAYDATIEGWSRALDLRDRETEGHSRRVTTMSEQLAMAMGVPESQLLHLRRGALLHDIGKMGIPDGILLKPGPLTTDEWVVMRQHPTFAYEMLAPIAYLRPALDIPYCHHEKWEGSGYPRGLQGERIPLAARIFAVVDVWDALCSDRPYRPAWPVEKVRDYIHEQAGTHFDPAVVTAFLKMDLRDY